MSMQIEINRKLQIEYVNEIAMGLILAHILIN